MCVFCVYVWYGCICLHVHVLCVYVCLVDVCMLVHVEVRGWHWLFPSFTLHFVFFCLSLNPEFTYWLASIASETLGPSHLLFPPLFPLLYARVTVHTTTSWFYVGTRDLSSAPHAFDADTLLTEP